MKWFLPITRRGGQFMLFLHEAMYLHNVHPLHVERGRSTYALPYPSTTQYGLPDTGSYLLDLIVPLVFRVKIDCPPLEGSAQIIIWPDTVWDLTDYTWFTDSKHTGTLRITEVDTINRLFSGTFNFLAIDTTKGSSMSDTVRVDSGIIYKMRLL